MLLNQNITNYFKRLRSLFFFIDIYIKNISMKNLFNNISQEEKNTILEMHSGKQNVISEQPVQVPTPNQIPGPNLAASGGGRTPQTKPKVNKTVNPKIDLDCNKKLIVNTQLPKLSKDANLAIINYFCQGTTSPQPGPGTRPTPQPGPGTRPTAQPGPNLARQQSQQPGPNLARQQSQQPRI